MKAFGLALCSLALLIASGPLMAQGIYTQFDVPGSQTTEGLAINIAGDITGIYLDSTNHSHGFLLSAGTFTTIDYPNAVVTSLLGINDVGQIVGHGDANGTGF